MPTDKITVDVNPSGCVMLRFTVGAAYIKKQIPFISSNNVVDQGVPHQIQWLSRYPSFGRSLRFASHSSGRRSNLSGETQPL